jgi:RNA recognition motif-containing protein
MEVYIGNISPNTTLNDVVTFLKSFAKKTRVRIVDHPLDTGGHARYALADFDTDKLALKAIKKLNGSVLRGNTVVMREFIHRSYSNERRAMNWRDKPWSGPERRQHERRQKVRAKEKDDFNDLVKNSKENEEKEKASVSISAYRNMARKF